MFFRRRHVGISVGTQKITRAIVRKTRGGGVVKSYQIEPLPSGVIVPSPIEKNILQPEVYKSACDVLLEKGKKPSRLSLGLPDGSVRLSLLEFQQLPQKKEELEQLIRWQMEKVFLYPLKEARLSFQDLGKRDGKRRLLAMAIRNEILTQYEAPLRTRGIEPTSVGIVSFHLFNLYLPYLLAASRPTRNFVFFSLVDHTFSILICRDGVIDFIRVKELPSYSEGERPEMGTLSLDRILGEISTSLAFYQESGNVPEIDHLFLSSDQSLVDIDEPLREKLQMTPVHLSPELLGAVQLPSPEEQTARPVLTAAASVIGGIY